MARKRRRRVSVAFHCNPGDRDILLISAMMMSAVLSRRTVDANNEIMALTHHCVNIARKLQKQVNVSAKAGRKRS